jgi:CBS domain-containing protein
MASTVKEIMNRAPVTVGASETLQAAARQMRDADVGALVVTDGGAVRGVVTDRDIAVRGVADGLDSRTATLEEIVTHGLLAASPDDDLASVVEVMRAGGVRRLPVLDGERLVGVVSLGDLAIEKDEQSALADISSQEPNN